jgi:hypothetical protein
MSFRCDLGRGHDPQPVRREGDVRLIQRLARWAMHRDSHKRVRPLWRSVDLKNLADDLVETPRHGHFVSWLHPLGPGHSAFLTNGPIDRRHYQVGWPPRHPGYKPTGRHRGANADRCSTRGGSPGTGALPTCPRLHERLRCGRCSVAPPTGCRSPTRITNFEYCSHFEAEPTEVPPDRPGVSVSPVEFPPFGQAGTHDALHCRIQRSRPQRE